MHCSISMSLRAMFVLAVCAVSSAHGVLVSHWPLDEFENNDSGELVRLADIVGGFHLERDEFRPATIGEGVPLIENSNAVYTEDVLAPNYLRTPSAQIEHHTPSFSMAGWSLSDRDQRDALFGMRAVGNFSSGFVLYRVGGDYWEARLGSLDQETQILRSSVAPSDTEWEHVAMTFEAVTTELVDDGFGFFFTQHTGPAKLYVNGSLVDESELKYTTQDNLRLNVGSNNSASWLWQGAIDDVRYYDHALTSQEVAELAMVEQIPGDFNNNGIVDAADYGVWLAALGAADETLISNNGDGGGVELSDYTFWKTRLGNSAGSGSAIGGGAVPEPTSLILFTVVAGCCLTGRVRVSWAKR